MGLREAPGFDGDGAQTQLPTAHGLPRKPRDVALLLGRIASKLSGAVRRPLQRLAGSAPRCTLAAIVSKTPNPTDDANPWHHERAAQLDTASITAFGIRLHSRLAQAQEMIELIEFARACADAGVNLFVSEAFYDSRQGCCHLKLSQALEAAGESAARAVLAAAAATLSQFMWDGGIHHGRDLVRDQDRDQGRSG